MTQITNGKMLEYLSAVTTLLVISRDMAMALLESGGYSGESGRLSPTGQPCLSYVDVIDQVVVEWFQNLDFDFQELAILG